MRIEIKKLHSFIKGFLNDPHKKSFPVIVKDLVELKKTNSLIDLSYYFNALMYKKDAGDIKRYVNRKVILKINNFNEKQGRHYYLDNKIRFAEKMTASGINIPKYIGKIENGSIDEIGGQSTVLNNKNLLLILKELVDLHKIIFVKSTTGMGGKGVFRFTPESTFDISQLNFQQDYMIDKGLEQHEILGAINSHCINTLRVMTVNQNGIVKIPNCIFRMGVNKSYLDNGTAGGILLNYDLDTNKMDDVALRLATQGGASFYSHPNSNFVFKDQSLPYPDKVKELVTQAANVFPDRSIIGWDVAYTPEGPVILEGNSNPCSLGNQICLRGLRNNKIYEEIYQPFYSKAVT